MGYDDRQVAVALSCRVILTGGGADIFALYD